MENTWQDNGCKESDQAFSDSEHQVTYDARRGISVADAVTWGMSVKAEVTLYLYDEGKGF
jgi:predicted AAA+ superfamily ATPase